jgi:N6-adenosine-specific RNA methylase IME4
MKRQCCICHSKFTATRSDAITCQTSCRQALSRLVRKCDNDLPTGPFNILYADPCWHFATYSKKGESKSPQSKYDTIGIEGLKRLPFKKIAAKDAWLFMWVYGPLADEASDVARAWGFEISSKEGFIWRKTTKDGTGTVMGTGYTTRKNAETMLIAKRGNPKIINFSVRQTQDHPRMSEHSEKPPLFRDLIVKLVGDLPRIELFSRHTIPGWEVWGNQVGKLDREENCNA